MKQVVPSIAALALLATALPATAYIRETTGPDPRSGTCQWWSGRNVTYQVNASGVTSTGCTVAEAEAATRAAFDAWNAVTCSDFALEPAAIPTTTKTSIGNDGVNLVVFRKGRCEAGQTPAAANCWNHDAMTLALTTTTYDTRTGEILDSDVELYASDGSGQGFNFTCSTIAPDYDVQAVVGHEAGHVLGLDHPCEYGTPSPPPGYPACGGGVQPAIMWPTTGMVSQRDLQQDDVDGVCTMYPVGQATLTCPPIEDDSGGGGCSSGGGAGIAALGAAAALAALRLLSRR